MKDSVTKVPRGSKNTQFPLRFWPARLLTENLRRSRRRVATGRLEARAENSSGRLLHQAGRKFQIAPEICVEPWHHPGMGNRLQIFRMASRVKRLHGKGYLSQGLDIVRLRFGFSGLAPIEYFRLGVYDDRRYPFAEKRKFLGYRGRYRLDRAFNLRTWHVIHSDKIITTLILERLNLLCPRIFAVFDRTPRAIPGVLFLKTEPDLHEFLAQSSFPLFIKPVDAAMGRGALSAVGYDAFRTTLLLTYGREISLTALFQQCREEATRGSGGTIFQAAIQPAAEVAALTGGRLAGLRIIVLFHEGEFRIVHAAIKFTTGLNFTDNMQDGQPGNLQGRVNLETGLVEEVFRFDGEDNPRVDIHPDSQQRLVGFVVPAWDRCRSSVLAAASQFPGLELQHWDIAIGERGPEILEVNVEGGLDLPQIVSQHGFLDGRVAQAFVAKRGR